MALYRFINNTERIYQFFAAEPGDVRDMDPADVPTDGLWVPDDGANPVLNPPPAWQPGQPPQNTTEQEVNDLENQGYTVTPPPEGTAN